MKREPLNRQPLFEQIAVVLREEILTNHQPGSRLATTADLAKRFQVSKLTISQALVVLNKEGLIDSRKGSGVFVRQRVDTRWVGILMDRDISDPRLSFFYVRVAQQLRSLFQQQGYPCRLYAGHTAATEPLVTLSCREFVEDARANKLRGVAVVQGVQHPEWVEPLRRNLVPVVGPGQFEHGVDSNEQEMVRQGTRRLIEAGRRKIAFMAWQPTDNGPGASHGWVEIFKSALREAGVPVQEQWIRHEVHPSQPGAGWQEFRDIWFASDEKPDGLLVCDDLLMRDATAAMCETRVQVPEQLMIVTHSNRGSGVHYPFPVWEMEFDPDEFARLLNEMLVKLMRKETINPQRVTLPFRWVNPQLKQTRAEKIERSQMA